MSSDGGPCLSVQVFGIPHIVDDIVASLPRASQVVCFRVNQAFYHAAARALYHTVAIDGDNMASFFRGVLGEDVDETFGCGILARTGECDYVERKQVTAELGRWDHTDPGASPPEYTGSEVTEMWDEPTVSVDPTTTCKGRLLRNVRVLSVGSHHRCHCYARASHMRRLFANVKILRVVPTIVDEFTLDNLCDDPSDVCPLVRNVPAGKIVIRNIDYRGMKRVVPPEPDTFVWEGNDVNEIVYFFPTDGRRYHRQDNNYANDMEGIAEHYHNVHHVKIVFFPDWETWHGPDPLSVAERKRDEDEDEDEDEGDEDEDDARDELLVNPDPVITCLIEMAWRANYPRAYIVDGLETVDFAWEGDWVDSYQGEYEGSIVQFVKDQIRSETLRTGMVGPVVDEVISYRTRDEYMADVGARPGEVNATDRDPHKPVQLAFAHGNYRWHLWLGLGRFLLFDSCDG